MNDLLQELARPFEPKHITWKPGAATKDGGKCMAMAYADLRAYQERLDEVCGLEWCIEYLPWGDTRVIARLTINGVTRSSTGEMGSQDVKNEMGGTVAEAQAMKRAAAQFGLGRYLYDLPSAWVEFDAQRKRISDAGQKELDAKYATWYNKTVKADAAPKPLDTAKLKLIDHLNALGEELYPDNWPEVRRRNAVRISNQQTDDTLSLTSEQIQRLIDGMLKLKEQRALEAMAA